jgi:hypothetical protein
MVHEFVDVPVGRPVVDPSSSTSVTLDRRQQLDLPALQRSDTLVDVSHLEPAYWPRRQVRVPVCRPEHLDSVFVQGLERDEVRFVRELGEAEKVTVQARHLDDR